MSEEANSLFTARLVECQIELHAFIGALMPDSPSDVRDVVQETNLAVIRRAADYDASKPFRPWLWAFARNQVKAFRTRRGRSPLVFDDELAVEASEAYSAEYPDRGDEGSTALLAGLEHCKKLLSDKHRRLLDLRYGERRDLPAIAREIRSNPNSAAATLAYVRKKLGECIRSFCRLHGDDDAPEEEPTPPEEKFLGSLIDRGWRPDEARRFRDDLRSPGLMRYWLDQNRVSAILSWDAEARAGAERLAGSAAGRRAFPFRRVTAAATGLTLAVGLIAYGARVLIVSSGSGAAAVAPSAPAAVQQLVVQEKEPAQAGATVGKETEMKTNQTLVAAAVGSVLAVANMSLADSWTNTVGSETYSTPAGASALTLSGAAFPAGALAVAGGTTVTAEAPDAANACPFPDSLLNGLAFWVDANKNVLTNEAGTGVAQWLDARETAADIAGQTWKRTRAITFVSPTGSIYSAVAPTFTNHTDTCPGKQFVDFGEYGSGKWLLWVSPTGAVVRQTVRSYFAVVGFGKTCGHLLSLVTDPDAPGGAAYFHKQFASTGIGNISSDVDNSVLYNGESRLNGARIDPRATSYLWDSVQLFSQNGPYIATNNTIPIAGDFLNDRNYKQANGVSMDRQGGAQIGEMLVYDRILDDNERAAVEAYLRNKWFGQPTLGSVNLASNATLAVRAEVPTALTDFSGAGDIVKSGEDAVTVARNTAAFSGSLRLEAGSWETVQNAEQPPIAPIAGTRLTAESRLLAADTNGVESGTFAIAGAGSETTRIRLAASAPAVKKVTVTDASLVLQPRAEGADAFAAQVPAFYTCGNLISNGSFEITPPIINMNGFTNASATYSGWVCKDAAGVARGVNSPWFKGTPIPDGAQYLYLQHSSGAAAGSATQSITVPAQGLYTLRFWMTRRTTKGGSGIEHLKLFLDGTNFYQSAVFSAYHGTTYYNETNFQAYATELPPLSAGTHTLMLTIDTNSTTDRAVILDKLELVPEAEGDYVYVPNPGFESSTAMTLAQNNNGYFTTTPSNAFWGFVQDATGGAGITQTSTWWAKPYDEPETDLADFRKAYIQCKASITNTVTFPRAGKVRFSMRYANRWSGSWSTASVGWFRFTGHVCHVYLDDTEVGSVAPVSARMRTYENEFEVAAGTYCLKIQNTVPDTSNDYATILDDIRICYVGTESAVVQDGGFVNAIGSGAWTSATASTPSLVSTETGNAVALASDEGVKQTVTIPSNGVYYVAVTAGGKLIEELSSKGVYNNYAYYPHALAVTLDGTNVGSIVTDTPIPQRYVIRLPYLAAGSHALALQGVAAESVSGSASLVRKVEINPLAVGKVSSCYDFSKATLDISGTGRLALDYAGSLKADTVKWNKVTVSGTINAKNYPAFVSGPGEIVSSPKGTIFTFRGN